MSRRKKVRLSDVDLNFIKIIFEKEGKGCYLWFVQLFSNGIIPIDTLKRMENTNQTETDMIIVDMFKNFYMKANSDVVSLLVAKVPSKQRKTLLNTFNKSAIERYMYSVVYSAHKNGKRVKTSQILDYIKRYKNVKDIDENKVKYIKMLKRVKKSVYKTLKKEEA